MTKSTLYLTARALLDISEQQTLDELLDWLVFNTDIARPSNPTGEPLAVNLCQESHLVGDETFGTPDEFSQFLRSCCTYFRAAIPDEDRAAAYKKACMEFSLKGLRIPVTTLPGRLTRYLSERVLGTALYRMIGDRAAADFKRGRTPPHEAEQLIRDSWDESKFTPDDRLAYLGNTVFATLSDGPPAASRDSQFVAEALALPCAFPDGTVRTKYLARVIYRSDAVRNHRFPTVADAQAFTGFRPSPEIEPAADNPASCFGLTAPLNSCAPQPELVHENASLQVLIAPLELLGGFER
jgi:hypothetical protein